jgi:hypothetical protein
MRFAVEQVLPGGPDAVIAALLDPAFIESLGASPRIDPPDLLDIARDGDRVVQRVRYRFAGDLSSAVAAVIDRSRLTWVTATTFDLASHSATFRVLPDHYADRLRCSGSHRYTATGRSIEGELTVRYPIVGKQIERAVLSGLEEHLAAERDLLTTHLGPG